MKHKLQTLLKHNWRTILLLLALVTICQEASARYRLRGDFNSWGCTEVGGTDNSAIIYKSANGGIKVSKDCNWDVNWGKDNSSITTGSLALESGKANVNWTAASGMYGVKFDGSTLYIYNFTMKCATSGNQGTKYLGDYVGAGSSGDWKFYFGIGNKDYSTVQAVVFKAANTPIYTVNASYNKDDGDNKEVVANLKGKQFTSTGKWYVKGRAKAFNNDTYGYTNGTDYVAVVTSLNANNNGAAYWTVNALPDPTSQSSSASGTTATVTWTHNSTYTTVMVVRYTGASPSVTVPTGGTSYSVGNSIGSGTVVYNGTSQSKSDTGLTAGTTYTYYLYTVNNNYYSSGVSTSVTIPSACTTPTKSQYTMDSGQSATYNSSAHAPSITINDGAGSVAKIYGSTDSGSTWSDYGTAGPINVGTYNIKVDVNAGGSYCAASGIILDNTYSITPASRKISINNTDVVCGAGTYTLLSTASPDDSGTKTYSIKSDPSSIASIDGSTLALTGAGTFTVQVNIAASGNYAAASGTKEFTVTLPTLSTSAATGISHTSATLNGSVSDDVTCTPSSSGFEYKKGSDAYTSVAAASATGSISKKISGLTPGTTYTFRTYTVVNGVTKYSSTRTFTTTSCSAPVISSSSLSAQSKCKDEVGTAMTVTASGGVGTLTYTWYKKNDTTPSGGTQVQSSTSNNYTPPTGTVGTLYYYCVVSSASPCASSTVNSGISGAVEIKAKPTLTSIASSSGTTSPYQPITFTSDMDADTSLENKGWGSTSEESTSYFVSKGTRTAVYKRGATSSARVWVIATNGCKSAEYFFTQTADTENCTQ